MPNKIQKSNTPWARPSPKTGSNYDKYNAHSWRKKSISYRTRNPICEVCKAKGKVKPVIQPGKRVGVCDHIIPVENGGSDNDKNLMSMCSYSPGSCHDKKRNLESRGIIVEAVPTETGKIPRDRNDIIKLLNK